MLATRLFHLTSSVQAPSVKELTKDAPLCPPWLRREEAKQLALLEGPKQLTIIQDPALWALRTNQLTKFMDDVRATDTYRKCMAAPETVYSPAGTVNMYEICDKFIIPWTKDTGSSIALLANPDGLEAEVMVSHVCCPLLALRDL